MDSWSELVERELRFQPDADSVLKIFRRLSEGGRSIIVSSVGTFKSAGKYLAHLMNSLSRVSTFYVQPHELMYYVAPYDEGREPDILLVATPGGVNDLYLLLDQLVLTGHRVALVTEPLPEFMKLKYGSVDLAEVPLGRMGLLKLLAVLAYSASRVAKEELSRRAERIASECLSIGQVADELVEMYREELKAIKDVFLEPHIVTYTPTMEPAAEMVSLGYGKSLAIMADISSAHLYVDRFARKVIAFTTDVEIYTVRYYLSKIAEKGGKTSEVRIRTDPLTAPLYALLLLYYVESGGG